MTTVAEVIAKLEQLPGDSVVLLRAWNGDHYNLMSDLAVDAGLAFNLNEQEYFEPPVEAWRTDEMQLGAEADWDADRAGESWDEAVDGLGARAVVIFSSEAVDDNARSRWDL